MSGAAARMHWPSRRGARAFAGDEAGNLTLFTLILLPLLFVVSGAAVDLMRQEAARVDLQQAFDSCALMSASLNHDLPARTMMEDCVADAGFAQSVDRLEVVDNGGLRQITVTGQVRLDSLFLNAIGMDRLVSTAAAQAQQGMRKIEVALVLDVSGSMAGAPMNGLRSAARTFVDTVLSVGTGRVSVAIIPYNVNVNLPPAFADTFRATDRHARANANCIDIPDAAHLQAGMPTNAAWSYTTIFDSLSQGQGYAQPPIEAYGTCPSSLKNVALLPTDDAATLYRHIDGILPASSTAIQTGLKWGSMFLSDRMRPQFRQMIAQGMIPAHFADRPAPYTDRDTLKVIVLMTDGENLPFGRVNAGYKTGPSPFFLGPTGRYAVQVPAPAETPFANFGPDMVPVFTAFPGGDSPVANTRRLDWAEVWASLQGSFVRSLYVTAHVEAKRRELERLYSKTGGQVAGFWASSQPRQILDALQADLMDDLYTMLTVPVANGQLQAACAAEKAAGVVIYGVVFMGNPNGRDQIGRCATSDLHYFDALTAPALNAAFQAIALDITKLRLTQ